MKGSSSGLQPPAAAPSVVAESPQPADAETLASAIVEILLRVVTSPKFDDEIPPETLCGVKNFDQLFSTVRGIRNLTLALSHGDLEYQAPEKGIIIGALKSLQSNLRHLTWQTKQIAGGDYGHTVSFHGDFADAFNNMTAQLAKRITTLTKAGEEYKNMSFRDSLTGIYNRKAFMHFAEDVFTTVRPALSSLIIADIDKFKNFNDIYGHLCGDEVLKLFAAHIAHALRPADICSRYGGEEFLILLPGLPLSVGMEVAERLRIEVEKLQMRFAGKELQITASFGVSETGPMPAEMSFNDFINSCVGKADANLYKAKNSGRNRVVG
jgi:diguanylate cyclase (GGDEF)-like protein